MKFLGILLGLPATVLAAEPAAQAATPLASGGIAGQLVQLLLGLLLVIGLIFLLAWLLRRVQQIGPRGGQVTSWRSSTSVHRSHPRHPSGCSRVSVNRMSTESPNTFAINSSR